MKIIQIASDHDGDITWGLGDDGCMYNLYPIREERTDTTRGKHIGWEWKNANVKYPDSQPASGDGHRVTIGQGTARVCLAKLKDARNVCIESGRSYGVGLANAIAELVQVLGEEDCDDD